MQKFNYQTEMHYPPTPAPQIKQSSKLARVKDHTNPPPWVDTCDCFKERYHEPSSPTQATPPSAVTRGKYTKTFKELVQQ